jgi:hypothetical protein
VPFRHPISTTPLIVPTIPIPEQIEPIELTN